MVHLTIFGINMMVHLTIFGVNMMIQLNKSETWLNISFPNLEEVSYKFFKGTLEALQGSSISLFLTSLAYIIMGS